MVRKISKKRLKNMSDIFQHYDENLIIKLTDQYFQRRIDGIKTKKLHNLTLFTYIKQNV